MHENLLLPGPERDSMYAAHPVVCNAVQIVTAPVVDAERAVRAAVLHRDPGTYFLGEPRMGKTTTIKMIESVMPQTFPGVPVFDLIAKTHQRQNEKIFYGDLLTDLDQTPGPNVRMAERRNQLLNHVIANCRTVLSDRAILFVDEGQNWGECEYEWMRDLTNDWRKRNVVCVTIVFAHPNLENNVKVRFLRRNRSDLTGRYLISRHAFRGLSNLDELRDSFEAYDNPKRHQFPHGSGICYSRFFFPRAFHGGWRLRDEAEIAWSLFSAYSKPAERSCASLGMQWVSAAVRNFIFAASDPLQPDARGRLWTEAIRAAVYDAMS